MRVIWVLVFVLVVAALAAARQGPGPTGAGGNTAATEGAAATNGSATGATAGQPSAAGETAGTGETGAQGGSRASLAERILAIRKLIDADIEQRSELEAEQGTLRGEFDDALSDFERIDARLAQARVKAAATVDETERQRLAKALENLQQARGRARDRLDRVLQRRKAVEQELATLSEKIALEQEFYTQLVAVPGASNGSVSGGGAAAATGAAPAPTGATGPTSAQPLGAAGATGAPAATGAAAPATRTWTSLLGLPERSVTAGATGAAPAAGEPLDRRLEEARQDLAAKRATLQAAEQRLARLDRAIDVFDRDLVSSRSLVETLQNERNATKAGLEGVEARIQERRATGASEDNLARLTTRRDELSGQLTHLQEQVERQEQRVAASEATLEQLKTVRANAAKVRDDAAATEKTAEDHLLFLESPIAPHQVARWFTERGPRVAAVVIVMVLLLWVSRLIGNRLVVKLMKRGTRVGAPERQARAETLRRVFESTMAVAIVVLGTLTALNQAGIDVTVLLGGAAVLGAAIAFGSQNLIKDYFSGFMILVENQYSVGNVVRIGDTTGTVEDITLRMTSLRDLEGVVHFVPHSQVTSVSNLTYGWSRIVLDVRVSALEDPDRAIQAVMDVARAMKSDTDFGPYIIGEPEMLGVDSIIGPAMIIKLLVKTRPLNRWVVKRELLRRIKKRFDEVGIKMA